MSQSWHLVVIVLVSMWAGAGVLAITLALFAGGNPFDHREGE